MLLRWIQYGKVTMNMQRHRLHCPRLWCRHQKQWSVLTYLVRLIVLLILVVLIEKNKGKWWYTGANTRTPETEDFIIEKAMEIEWFVFFGISGEWHACDFCAVKNNVRLTLFFNIGHCDFRHLGRRFQRTIQNANHPNNETDDARLVECNLQSPKKKQKKNEKWF